MPKRFFQEIVFLVGLSLLIGFGVNFSLLKKYFRGDFKESFVSGEDYPGISFITLGEAEGLFAWQEAVFIDSRSREEYLAGHVPGAVSIPLDEVMKGESFERYGIPFDQAVVVYCVGGACQESVILAKLLHDAGFKDIRVFLGGWEDWILAGLPTAEGIR